MSILSNGEKEKTQQLLSNNGIIDYFDNIFSIEEIKKYKPSPEPYKMAAGNLNLQISDALLISSNLWDIFGAQCVGMKTCWLDRIGEEEKKVKEELDVKPDITIGSIRELKKLLIA